MHSLINAMILAATLPANPADMARDVPMCSAELAGHTLSTQVRFADGYVVEGPWHVRQTEARKLDDGTELHTLAAAIDRLVEVDALTLERRTTRFPRGVMITFRGNSAQEVVDRAAELWCATVLRLTSDSTFRAGPPAVTGMHVAAVALPVAGVG